MIISEILLFLFLLLLSSIFSGSETAYFSINKKELSSKEAKEVMSLLQNPKRLLITLITGNTIVNSAMAILAALITADIANTLNLNLTALMILETLVVTLTILILSEITPKIIAIRNSTLFAKKLSVPIRIFMFLLFPLAIPIYRLTNVISKLLPLKREVLFDSEDELVALANLGAESGSIEQEESEMIKSVFEYGDTAVREIMVPRIDIVGIDINSSISKTIELVKKTKFSKFPIYNDNLDTIHGILYAKDILPFVNGNIKEKNISSLCREAYFVPESKQIDSLLKDFQRRKVNIAIVVDEYGGTAGLVTVEDIVEEVVGDIRDEFDIETQMISLIGPNRWLVDAKISIHDFESQIPISFEEDREFDTLGGFFFFKFGDIPKVGTNVKLSDFRFQVRTMEGNRILKIEITRDKILNDNIK